MSFEDEKSSGLKCSSFLFFNTGQTPYENLSRGDQKEFRSDALKYLDTNGEEGSMPYCDCSGFTTFYNERCGEDDLTESFKCAGYFDNDSGVCYKYDECESVGGKLVTENGEQVCSVNIGQSLVQFKREEHDILPCDGYFDSTTNTCVTFDYCKEVGGLINSENVCFVNVGGADSQGESKTLMLDESNSFSFYPHPSSLSPSTSAPSTSAPSTPSPSTPSPSTPSTPSTPSPSPSKPPSPSPSPTSTPSSLSPSSTIPTGTEIPSTKPITELVNVVVSSEDPFLATPTITQSTPMNQVGTDIEAPLTPMIPETPDFLSEAPTIRYFKNIQGADSLEGCLEHARGVSIKGKPAVSVLHRTKDHESMPNTCVAFAAESSWASSDFGIPFSEEEHQSMTCLNPSMSILDGCTLPCPEGEIKVGEDLVCSSFKPMGLGISGGGVIGDGESNVIGVKPRIIEFGLEITDEYKGVISPLFNTIGADNIKYLTNRYVDSATSFGKFYLREVSSTNRSFMIDNSISESNPKTDPNKDSSLLRNSLHHRIDPQNEFNGISPGRYLIRQEMVTDDSTGELKMITDITSKKDKLLETSTTDRSHPERKVSKHQLYDSFTFSNGRARFETVVDDVLRDEYLNSSDSGYKFLSYSSNRPGIFITDIQYK